MYLKIAASLTLAVAAAAAAEESPEGAGLTVQNAVVGEIVLEKSNVFDLSNPKENNGLYRLANRLHFVTKGKVIKKQLLFQSGSPVSEQLIGESERILRQNRYLYDGKITATPRSDGIVDITVATRDVWSLGPDISASRSGGENRTQIGLEDTNLFGRGQTFRFNHENDVDRTSDSLEFFDRHYNQTRVSVFLRAANNSDGKSNLVSIVRPFYALDSRWTAGASALDDDRRSALYYLGEEAVEYQHARRSFSVFGGWSKGLQNGFARRWSLGLAHDDNRYSAVTDPTLPSVLPGDRKLVTAFATFELVEDEFETSRNRDQIGRTEDFMLGLSVSASLGWADESFGSDRDALVYSARAGRGFGSLLQDTLILSVSTSGRVESGNSANSLLAVDARYYKTQSPKRLFFATVNATAGHNLDLDSPVQLGGDSGLRGYPLRYQNGESKVLLTIEQRYFTDWYPFRLARIGGALFADAGRVWGDNPLGNEEHGWLSDVGFGLRIAPTRGSSRKMVHLDVAFPLNGDESIDDVQFLLEAKSSF